MNSVDMQYLSYAREILYNGFDHKVEGAIYKDGSPVTVRKLRKRAIMEFDLEKGFPALTSKKLAWKFARNEMFWFYVLQSNDVRDLQELGVPIWNEWMGKDYTIGKAYGYQVKKYKLIDRILDKVDNNPYDRGLIINLWNEEDLPHMNIRPCAFLVMFDVVGNRLDCTLVQRSGDWGLGIPFNFTQYAMLTHMIAHVKGLKAGLLTHVINNAHIYDRHFKGMKENLKRLTHKSPKIWINPEVKNFYDFKPDDIQLTDYICEDKISMEVAVVINPNKESNE